MFRGTLSHLPSSTGVDATIVLAFGDRFPMIGAHKVQAAYACLAPRVVTGQLDPTSHRAIGHRRAITRVGGVAISRIMDCRGVAVLPENMSRERFEWLERWVTDPADIIRTAGSESNVKEIYDDVRDACALDPVNVVLNQFCEFGNHIAHRLATGRAMEAIVEAHPDLRAGVRIGLRLCRHAGRGRQRSRNGSVRSPSRSRPSSARRCSATGSASTTSRGSVTSTSRTSTTSWRRTS